MKKGMAVLLAVVGMVVSGFLVTDARSFELITETETVVVEGKEVDIVKMADNFIVMFDSSSSMGKPYKETGTPKIEVEKAVLRDRNAKLPDLKYNAGLYTFSPKPLSMKFKTLETYYEMQPYDKEAFAAAIEKLPTKAGGPTLLQQGLHDLDKILAGVTGRTVVFVVTDGMFTNMSGTRKPVEIAQKLAGKYDVCFYVISNAPSQQEAMLLKRVASINECSRVIPFDIFVERPEFLSGALFVLEEKIVEDVINVVKVVGVELDNVLFDFNDSTIKPEFTDSLNALGKFMQGDPTKYVVLSGFADNLGTQEYNLGLSRKRAGSVAKYLAGKFGIDPVRIVTHWYGEAAPVADNNTEEGQSLNRRVEMVVAELP